jgi:hypothetical protein
MPPQSGIIWLLNGIDVLLSPYMRMAALHKRQVAPTKRVAKYGQHRHCFLATKQGRHGTKKCAVINTKVKDDE